MVSDEARELSVLLGHVFRFQMSAIQKRLEEEGLSRSQPGIVHILSHHDGLTQVELASKLNVTPATVSAMLKRMERDNVIIRKRSQEDQRVTHVYLTEKGREQSNIIDKVFKEMSQQGFGNFTDEELNQAKVIFEKLKKNFSDISC